MKNFHPARLLLAAGFALTAGLALAQGTTPGSTPTNPAPETMGTPKSEPTPTTPSGPAMSPKSGAMQSDTMSTGTDAMPTKAECAQMMKDKKAGKTMDDMAMAKYKHCESMHKGKKAMSDGTTGSDKMN